MNEGKTAVRDAELADDVDEMLRPQQARSEVAISARRPEMGVMDFIEARARVLERLTDYAVKATDASHWEAFGEKPRLNHGGALLVARTLGIRWYGSEGPGSALDMTKEVGEDENGPWYRFRCEGTFQIGKSEFDIVPAMGTSWSRENFLGENESRSFDEIDEGNLRKKAHTQCHVNGISELTGLKGMSWERLKAIKPDMDPGKVAKVGFKSGSKGGGRQKDWTVPFGDNKGKGAADLSERDLGWWKERLAKGLADVSREKYHPQDRAGLEAIDAEIARRGATKAAPSTPPAGAPAPSVAAVTPGQRYLVIGKRYGKDEPTLRAIAKSNAGKDIAQLTETDVENLETVLDAMSQG